MTLGFALTVLIAAARGVAVEREQKEKAIAAVEAWLKAQDEKTA